MTDPPDPARRPMAFISQHSSHYEAARMVKAALARAGIDGWLAPDDIEPGATFDTAIVEQVKRSDLVVLLLSAQSDQSRHVKRELMIADDANKPIFPVRIEDIEADGLAYWLKDYQWIDWIDQKGDGLDRLVAAITRRTGTPGEAPPKAAPPRGPMFRKPGFIAAGTIVALALAGGAVWMFAPSAMAPEPYFDPGLWLNKREVIAITYPELPQESADQIKQTIENDPNPEECIAEDVARNPDVKLFDPGNKGGCTLSAFQIGNGRMSGYLNCPMPGVKNAIMQVAFKGNFTKTSIEIDQDITMTQPDGVLKFKARETSHWVAKDCGRDRR